MRSNALVSRLARLEEIAKARALTRGALHPQAAWPRLWCQIIKAPAARELLATIAARIEFNATAVDASRLEDVTDADVAALSKAAGIKLDLWDTLRAVGAHVFTTPAAA